MSKKGIMLYQRKYVKEIIKRFRMDDSAPASLLVEPNLKLEKYVEEDIVDATLNKQIVGSLRYVCNNRPDIGLSFGSVSIYMSELRVAHMKIARRILRHLKGSINYEIIFRRDSESKKVMVTCYSYDDWCGDKEDQKSTTDYFFQVFGAQSHGA